MSPIPLEARGQLGSDLVSARLAASSFFADGEADVTEEGGTTNSGHIVEVSYEGRTAEVFVRRDESILSALERSGAVRRLAISDPPFECRRGNCLTCAGRHAEGSATSNLRRGEDGLSPYLSEEVRGLGYVLTCSSYVEGDGVKLDLGSNSDAWEDVHTSRLQSPETERTGLAAQAKLMRLTAEGNVPRWVQKTEEALKITETGDDNEP